MEAHPNFKLPDSPLNNSISQAYKRGAQVRDMAVHTERGQNANMKAFLQASGARPAAAANLRVPLIGSVIAFMAQPQPAFISSRDDLMDQIDLLSVETGMDPHELYRLIGRASEMVDPPTSSVTSAATPSSVTLFIK